MAEFPSMPFWTDAYLGDTGHLDDAQHGRYILVLIHLWRTPKQRFPNDDGWLARKFQRSVEAMEAEIKPILREFCRCDGNWWTQKRLTKEFNYVRNVRTVRSVSAKTRWQKEKALYPLPLTTLQTPRRVASDPDKSLADKGSAKYIRNTPTPTPTPQSGGVGGVGSVSRAAPDGARSHRPTAPMAIDVERMRKSWRGNASALVDRIGPVKFQAWFTTAAFSQGPPVSISFPKEFQWRWACDHFRNEIEQAYGNGVELVLRP